MVSKAAQQLACVAADGRAGAVVAETDTVFEGSGVSGTVAVGDSAGAMLVVGDDEMAVASVLVKINSYNFLMFYNPGYLS